MRGAIQTRTKTRPSPCAAYCLYYTIKTENDTSIIVIVSSKHRSGREKRCKKGKTSSERAIPHHPSIVVLYSALPEGFVVSKYSLYRGGNR